MCGIFAVLGFNNSIDDNSQYKQQLDHHFNLGKSRGPEHSIITQINDMVLFGFHHLDR